MKNRKRIAVVLSLSIISAVIAYVNGRLGIIAVPDQRDMIDRQIDYITISTVFAGFSFTSLGLLLGMSGERLIIQVKNTSIIANKVNRIVTSIIFFLLSFFVSMLFVLGINESLFGQVSFYVQITNWIYVLGVLFLFLGVAYFCFSVYELYDLIKRVFGFNNSAILGQIDDAKKEMGKNQEALSEARYDD